MFSFVGRFAAIYLIVCSEEWILKRKKSEKKRNEIEKREKDEDERSLTIRAAFRWNNIILAASIYNVMQNSIGRNERESKTDIETRFFSLVSDMWRTISAMTK